MTNPQTYIGGHLGGNDLIPIVPKKKVKVCKEKSLATFRLTNNQIFVSRITHVAPQWKILHKHFKEIFIVNRLFEGLKILR